MKKIIVLFVIVTSTIGCATIVKGSHDTISVSSLEQDTALYVDDRPIGKDTAQVVVKKGNPHFIKASKEGCTTSVIETGESYDAVSLFGILFDFGIFSIPIDLITGSAWKTSPLAYTATPICKSVALK